MISLGIFWRSATSSKAMASQMPTRPTFPIVLVADIDLCPDPAHKQAVIVPQVVLWDVNI
jgi:hypothetical protein